MSEVLSNLNDAQREAVLHFKGPILVLAGAGSGKTRVLTRRIAHLILNHNVRPENILAVTFTNKATEEMRERLEQMLGQRAKGLWVSTFHSACLRILRRHAGELGYLPDFAVYDEQDSKNALKQVLKECSIDEKKFPLQGFTRAFDKAKNAVIGPDDYYGWASGKGVSGGVASGKGKSWNESSMESGTRSSRFGSRGEGVEYQMRLQAEVYGFYQKALLRANAMDFGDLLLNGVLLLEGNPRIREYYERQLQFVLVDEFQDTNEAQYRLVRLLTERHRNLLVVGDDDQSIYAFRGASIRNILEFENDYKDTKVVTLDRNYRSSANILDAAYAVIQHNTGRKEKKLWTEAPAGDPLRTFVGADEMEEAQFVAERVATLKAEGTALRDVAVFYRTNAQSRVLEEAFLSAGIPYRIFGGLRFYDRKEIKDILAYLRLILNPADDQAFLRVINTPPRGIGAQTIDALQRAAREANTPLLEAARAMGKSAKKIAAFITLFDEFKDLSNRVLLSELMHAVIERSGYGARLKDLHDATSESRRENLMELEAIGRAASHEGGSPLESLRLFLDKVSLASAADIPEESGAEPRDPGDSVAFMTLHLAKGLEFPVVFLVGCEEGLLPHYRAIYDPVELEEERRLCYVGITRAMKSLFLTRAITRGMFAGMDTAGGLYRDPSRFLNDIPPELQEQQSSTPRYDEKHWEEDDYGDLRQGEEYWDKDH